MGVAIFFIVIIFVVWLKYELGKNSNSIKNSTENFWKKESIANSTRKKPINSLNYIIISEKSLPHFEINNEKIENYEKQLLEFGTKKILNLNGKTNTELKLEYGVSNLAHLSECDSNFISLCSLLYKYGHELLELGYTLNACIVFEYSVDIGSDISSVYKELGNIYHNQGNSEGIKHLINKATELNSLLKPSIIEYLNSLL